MLSFMNLKSDVINSEKRDVTRRLFHVSDVIEITLLSVLTPISVLLPPQQWSKVATALAKLDQYARSSEKDRRKVYFDQIRFEEGPSGAQLMGGMLADNILIRLSALRKNCLPSWRPKTGIKGVERVRDALDQGSGAILWIADTTSSYHETHSALSEVGLPGVRITRPTHGFSRSRFGIRVLNPLRARLENRVCRDTIVIDRGTTRIGMERVKDYVRKGYTARIRVGDHASQVIRVPFARGRLRLAAGPVRLAAKIGVPLYPLYTSGRVTGQIQIDIGEALPVEGLRDIDLIKTGLAYANWLESYVREDPSAWRSWFMVEPG